MHARHNYAKIPVSALVQLLSHYQLAKCCYCYKFSANRFKLSVNHSVSENILCDEMNVVLLEGRRIVATTFRAALSYWLTLLADRSTCDRKEAARTPYHTELFHKI